MRSIWVGLLVLVVLGTAGLGWWIGWGRFTAGPPEAVVGALLRAAQAGNWGTGQADMSRRMQGRLAREGGGGPPPAAGGGGGGGVLGPPAGARLPRLRSYRSPLVGTRSTWWCA